MLEKLHSSVVTSSHLGATKMVLFTLGVLIEASRRRKQPYHATQKCLAFEVNSSRDTEPMWQEPRGRLTDASLAQRALSLVTFEAMTRSLCPTFCCCCFFSTRHYKEHRGRFRRRLVELKGDKLHAVCWRFSAIKEHGHGGAEHDAVFRSLAATTQQRNTISKRHFFR